MFKLKRQAALAILLLSFAILTNGCTYFKARGNDALDMFDAGITVNKTCMPQFAFYFDFFNMFPVGFAHTDVKTLGIVNSQAGWLDYTNHDWGVVAWGSEKEGAAPFNPADPYQARKDQRDLTERPRFDVGCVRTFVSDNRAPWKTYIMCNRHFHLGHIGVVFNIRPMEILDFLVGWTTLDISGDDHRAQPETEKKA